jgi:hypothetical protein
MKKCSKGPAKQQAVSVLNKARDAYNAQLQKGKEIGLDEAAHRGLVCSIEV